MKKPVSGVRLIGETKGARRATAVSPTADASPPPEPVVPPDPEVPEQARRRQFSTEYKLRILREADACSQPGEVGALLRREGLYSSLLSAWRRQREAGVLEALRPKKRGRKAARKDVISLEMEQLRKENARLQQRLEQAELIMEVQKKVSEILGIPLNRPKFDEND